MIDPGLISLGVALIASLAGFFTYLSNRRLSKDNRVLEGEKVELERQKVEAAAYERARAHYDAIIDELTQHINWLKQELAEQIQENGLLRLRIEALEKTIEALKSPTPNVIVIDAPRDTWGTTE